MLNFRASAPALLLLAVSAVLYLVGLNMGTMAAPHADVTELGSSFGPWLEMGNERTDPKDLALDDATAQSLDLDSYTNRLYRNVTTGQTVEVLVEYRRFGRGSFNHRPEECYPAAGFALSDRRTTSIIYNGHPARAITCVADYNGVQGHDHQTLLYWFANGNNVVSNFFLQQVEMAFGRLQPNKNGWAFVRVISLCNPGQEAQALAAEKDFTRWASPDLVRVISGTAPAASAPAA